MEKPYDSTVSQRGGGSTSKMMGIPAEIAEKMKLQKGDKLRVWLVVDDDGKFYLVGEKREPETPPKILSRLRSH